MCISIIPILYIEIQKKRHINNNVFLKAMSQENLINCDKARIRCIAGPGTGKTWAINNRVERLLIDKVPGSKIFIVTFTRLAATQMKNELTEMEVEGADEIVSSTLHSHALKILGHEQAIESLGRYPRICFEYEMKPFFNDLSMNFENHIKPVTKLLKSFETMWAQYQYQDPRYASEPEEQLFENQYHNWMRFHQAMTVGELIPLAVTFLNQNPINDAVTAFEHIIVDEYQDLNRADQMLIELISEKSNVLIVGDDDQSIYSFRFANPDGIRTWLSHQPKPKEDIQLNLCRRCDGKIISLANSLIKHNSNRNKEDIIPMVGRENAGQIDFVQWNTRNNETKGIAKGIKMLLETNKVPEDEKILVLVPRREFGQYLVQELTNLGIEDIKLHTKPDWTDLGENLTLLILHDKPNDLVALRYWLGLGNASWKKTEYKRLREYCQNNDIIPQDVLENIELCNQLRIKSLHGRWVELQLKLKEFSELNDDEILNLLLPLEGEAKKISEAVRELKQFDTEDQNLVDLLTQAIISTDQECSDARINIMTIYGAKGLTSHTVILTSLINGLLPVNPNPQTTEDKEKLDEERRLLYVALTRAKKQLIISSFRKVTQTENQRLRLGLRSSGRYCSTQSSKFISEFGSGTPQTLNGDDWLSS